MVILYELQLLLSRLGNLLVLYQVLLLAITRCARLNMPSDGLGFFFPVTSDVEVLWLDSDIADDASSEKEDERPRKTTR
jgi:hypothetical protein